MGYNLKTLRPYETTTEKTSFSSPLFEKNFFSPEVFPAVYIDEQHTKGWTEILSMFCFL